MGYIGSVVMCVALRQVITEPIHPMWHSCPCKICCIQLVSMTLDDTAAPLPFSEGGGLSGGHVVFTQVQKLLCLYHDSGSIYCTLYKILDHCFL